MTIRNAAPAAYTREELYKTLDVYLDALRRRDPSAVPWADVVRNTEDNVAMDVGDGLWGTITGLGDYQLRFADVKTGQVGYFGAVEETNETSAFSLRLKIDRDGRVSEVETLVVRISFSGLGIFANKRFWDKPVLNETVPSEHRVKRERMISIADGYFDTLQLNDGEIFTKFHPDCNRVENGVQTTNNPEFAKEVNYPIAALGCEAQFKRGQYLYDDELRARRFPLVDEELGLVLASGFIDHAGRLGDYELTDGTKVVSPFRRPHSFYLLELFKIEDGAIRQIEANFITVPYKMPSPWDR
ncbi:hypothetical protein [Hyphococcus luteus]|uniref:DUF8021 domain-containing protein n=1 Tax=Hyphococcus luteus TaxID=2058213 RepID=A0A2S7K273_9PROT|nr:hypothetical protein [Marinicaulis flavus]PQA86586.1 hypothetical protein CW354_17015 [Marinicaulis flavus]